MNFEGKIISKALIHKERKDIDADEAVIVIGNDSGLRITINGEPEILDGIKPEDEVLVVISPNQKTLDESIGQPDA